MAEKQSEPVPTFEGETKPSEGSIQCIVLSDSDSTNDLSDAENTEKEECDGNKNLECAVCLQTCVHPARLPCRHIFCFLCLKGIAHGSKRCAMCRHPIPPDYLDNPDLVETIDDGASTEDDGYQWFYEGRNGGWWQFEERMSEELEEMRKSGITRFEMLICGSLYLIDLGEMIQYRRDRPHQKRRIIRERSSQVVKKGVAGIK